ncbi:two-component sensor histidine kinase [Malaciobacter mytili LMG 24559]|uniref:histidine kinase n=1 Tax=Malaciobacter mytili LMG 24559 TaxID=1032238 RepID=A0AAX2AHY7_9BACT|nr:HAMP domain-containing sensor histidine kinase [Malaciobacter mytili]AXH13724.1 two-component system sensor histidine kinase, putative CusS [Malaciobacter mytili LMG 24559]RXK16334.1 two-component sensor histidine kinase [Malaciobacter mytili LMG 24559]
MVIVLTRSEKSALVRFLGLYLGSSFILLTIIAWLFYKVESNLYYDLITSNMKNVAAKISSTIIYAQMTNQKISPEKIRENIEFDFALYDHSYKKLVGNIPEKIDFSKKIKQYDNSFILIDDSALGHLGVNYVVIKENIFYKKIYQLKEKILISFLLIFAFLFITGFYLAKMFIKPITNERLKLNNFIKDTTHELNTPITAILMCTSNGSSLSEKNIQRINLSAKRISEIYKDLIYLFLEEKKKETPSNLRIDLILNEQIEYFKTLASKKRVEIKTDIKQTTFFIDKESFIRLCNNLISNAIKYNKIGGEIDIILKDNKMIVKDTGIGINKQNLKDIFKRFYRANNVQGGFGIGLNIVYTICNEYDIKVDVDSKEKEGTTFILTFKE